MGASQILLELSQICVWARVKRVWTRLVKYLVDELVQHGLGQRVKGTQLQQLWSTLKVVGVSLFSL